MKELLFIYNPVSGMGLVKKICWDITDCILEGIKQLSDIKSYHMQVQFDDCCYEGDFNYTT